MFLLQNHSTACANLNWELYTQKLKLCYLLTVLLFKFANQELFL